MGEGGGKMRRFGRWIYSAIHQFYKDDCYNKSSALTFYTIQSIVPLLAFLLGIAKGFGFDTFIEGVITRVFHEQKEVMTYAIQLAHSMLDHIQGGVIVGFGVLFLIYTVVSLLSYINSVFNEIWKIKVEKPYFQRLSNYVAAMVLCPILVGISSSLTFYFKDELAHLKFIPYLLSWIFFFLLYLLLPDTGGKVWPKVVGSLFAGVAFQLWQILYITLQSKVFSYNLVYGAFAIIPLFLLWVQFSWLIALAGAEIAACLETKK